MESGRLSVDGEVQKKSTKLGVDGAWRNDFKKRMYCTMMEQYTYCADEKSDHKVAYTVI